MSLRRRLEDRLEKGLSSCMLTCLLEAILGFAPIGLIVFWKDLRTPTGVFYFLAIVAVDALVIWWLLVREKE